MTTPYAVPKLTDTEKILVSKINSEWDKSKALLTLKSSLQVAVTIELATIPIYLYAYYSINRKPGSGTPKNADAFPKTTVSRFADKAGALIMSVAIEEMLHMSLSSNVLYSLGQDPVIYGQSPSSYPAILPHHAQNVSRGTQNEPWNIPIPLAKFSFDHLSHLLAIEYPAPADAPPEGDNWDTIGQIYSYIRCIISSRWIEDSDFRAANQIQATEFSPNCIDTVSPNAAFNYVSPVAPPEPGSTASVADFASDEDSHLGHSELLTISSCEDAMEAIATISFQGEGFAQGAYDDNTKEELSHYYKFLTLQSELVGYNQDYINDGKQLKNNVAPLPKAPPVPTNQFTDKDLGTFVIPVPDNPVASNFTQGRAELVNIADGLYQYMLIMTETIFRVPSGKQKIFFNRTMHQSMIWILDKFLQSLRGIKTADGKNTLCATFANYDLGDRAGAFANLTQMVTNFTNKYGKGGTDPQLWYTESDASGYLDKIANLPDVGVYWGSAPPALNPSYLELPSAEQGTGTGTAPIKPPTKIVDTGPFAGTPKWPLNPPMDSELPSGSVRHSCMGLNSCKNQGRTSSNECAGQGYCGTALSYNPVDPQNPVASDHTCHVLNDCRNQGGCGLYGTQQELANPGSNECQSLGSCATPINAERFITDGDLRGKSVWLQARAVFKAQVWPGLREANPNLPADPPEVPGSHANANLFQYGPTIEWIENDNGGQGMTACGASGMSGAGSCA